MMQQTDEKVEIVSDFNIILTHRVFYFFFDVGRNHPLSRNCPEIMLHFSRSPDLIPLYVLFHQLWNYAALFTVT